MSDTTRKILSRGLKDTNPQTYVGREGEVFYNPENLELRASDGSTPGGTAVGFGSDININTTGIITASAFYGNIVGSITEAVYAETAGIATYAETAGIATSASTADVATYAEVAGIATQASTADVATYSSTAGVSTVAQGLTGTPDVVAGIVTASSFVGDGSGLTGLIGVGSGIEVEDDASPVGTAATINFGNNLNVTFDSGVATIDAVGGGGGGESYWVSTTAGIHTLSNVGIGTTNPIALLDVKTTIDTSKWIARYGDVGINATPEYFSAARFDSQGKIYITGAEGNDGIPYVIKFDTDGTIIWQKSFDHPDPDKAYKICEALGVNKNTDEVYIAVSPDDNIASIILVKLNSDGDIIWQQEIDYPYGEGWPSGFEVGVSIAVDVNNNVILGGVTGSSGAGSYDFLIVKFDSDGNELWQRTLGSDQYDYSGQVATDSNGNVYCTFEYNSTSSTYHDLILVKLDSDGNELWQRYVDGDFSYDYPYGVAVDSLNNPYVVGQIQNPNTSSADATLVKFDADGNQIWQRTLEKSGYQSGISIAIDSNDLIYIHSSDSSVNPGPYNLTCFDSDGNLVWHKVISGNENLNWYWYWGVSYLDTHNDYLVASGYETVGGNYSLVNGIVMKIPTSGEGVDGTYGLDGNNQFTITSETPVIGVSTFNVGVSTAIIGISTLPISVGGLTIATSPLSFTAQTNYQIPVVLSVNGSAEFEYLNVDNIQINESFSSDSVTTNNFTLNGLPFGKSCGNFGNFIVGRGAGRCNTDGYYNNFLGLDAGRFNTTGCHNNFLGSYAGRCNTTGNYNNFFGQQAGRCNTTGCSNNFLGGLAGYCNTAGSNNNFFGFCAGYCNINSYGNNFFGKSAGCSNTYGSENVFIGSYAGGFNTDGNNNQFIGICAGYYNTIGEGNIFLGTYSAYCNTTGSYNIFFGANTGISTSASSKVIIGSGTGNGFFDSPDTTKDTQFAVGVKIGYDPSKYWLVGNENFNIGIGTTNPQYKLDVGGDINFTGTLYQDGTPFSGGGGSGIGSFDNVSIGVTGDIRRSDTGVTGIATETGRLPGTFNFSGDSYSGQRITTTAESGTVTVIPHSLTGPGIALTAADFVSGGTDDGAWELNIPFDIEFIGITTNIAYLTTNSYITFTDYATDYDMLDPEAYAVPALPKIMVSAGDAWSSQMFYDTFGDAPNRTFCVRYEGLLRLANNEELYTPNQVVWEAIFYENNPSQIDIQIGSNPRYVSLNDPSVKLNVDGVIGFTDGNIKIGDKTTGRSLTNYCDLFSSNNNVFLGVGAGQSTTYGSGNNFIGLQAGRSNTNGSYNNFFGHQSGYCNTTGNHNNFLGYQAGFNNYTAYHNNFFGHCAGFSNVYGGANNFFGSYAGGCNTTGSCNNFLGSNAGFFNTTGCYNNFLGVAAGVFNTTGCSNNFFGSGAGYSNTTGSCNNFLGVAAGRYNTTGCNNNFLGSYSGISTSASYKVVLGSGGNAYNQRFDSPDTTKDTQFAVGVRTDSNPSKYWLVGNENFNVGIGTTNPQYKLDVGGIVRADSFVGDGSGLVGVIGTGNGVEIQDDGSPVGTAATINFGSNLNVTFGSGVATIDAVGGGGGGESQWVTTNAGIHTLSNVGVGTTNPLTSLNIFSDSSPTLSITHTFASTIIRGFYFVNDPSSNNLDIRRYFNGFQTALLAISNNGDVTPAGNDNNLLGSGSERWKNIYSNIFTVGIGATIGSPTNNVLTLGTNSSEGMRINASNNVGIGTTNPQYKLDVGGDINLTGTVYRNGSPIAIGRTTITQTTGTLGIGSTANITFTNGIPKYALLKASTSSGAWVTLYTDSASRTSDASRSIDTDPTPGSGVIAEMISTGTGITTQRFTPGVIGYNDDEPVSNNIYVKVYNNSGISTDITVTLTISE